MGEPIAVGAVGVPVPGLLAGGGALLPGVVVGVPGVTAPVSTESEPPPHAAIDREAVQSAASRHFIIQFIKPPLLFDAAVSRLARRLTSTEGAIGVDEKEPFGIAARH